MKRQAEGANQAKYTQVAFVEPGKYRLTCDLSAAWAGKSQRPVMLRTGALSFEVTEEDLARKRLGSE